MVRGVRRKHSVKKKVTMETEKGRDDRTFKNYFPIVRKLKNKSGKSTRGIKVRTQALKNKNKQNLIRYSEIFLKEWKIKKGGLFERVHTRINRKSKKGGLSI